VLHMISMDNENGIETCLLSRSAESDASSPVIVEYESVGGLQNKKRVIEQNFPGIVFEGVVCLTGTVNLDCSKDSVAKNYLITAGQMFLGAFEKSSFHSMRATGEGAGILHLFYPYDILYATAGGDGLLPAPESIAMKALFSGMVLELYPAMNRIISAIYSSFQRNRHEKLFVAARALELLHLFFSIGFSETRPHFSNQDRKAIQESVFIIENNLESPPCLIDLARHVGMSVSKFKMLFPKAYGMTPYEYLRKKRMEKAMYLLRHKKMNVTEVAMEVGYSSLSHFAKVFLNEHKIKPSHVQKKLSNLLVRKRT